MAQASRKFLALQREWYGKLAAEGFQDCEELRKNGDLELKQRSCNVYGFTKELREKAEFKESYFDLLKDSVDKYRYEARIERLIMMRRAEGATIKEISEELREVNDPRCGGYRQTIRFIIRTYENAWGIIKWKPEEMKVKRWIKKALTK